MLTKEEQEQLAEIRKWSDIKEHALKQKSRVNLIIREDANTKYFHA